ncbi:MAG TPA: transporter substrate-binding domain-containing protein [Polyangiaceae bacterium]|nr:transporter substrate-binding domain-containing protein [Polyangiaceae bacterium]
MAFRVMRHTKAFVSLTIALGCARQPPGPIASQGAPQVVASAATSSSPPPRTRPHLRVGTSGDYAPFSVRDAGGAVRGFDAEIAGALSSDLDLELEWVSFRWPTLQSQLQNGEFDVAMGGVTWQPARGVVSYLTRAVARGGPCVLGDEQAKRVAVNHGGVLEAWARGHFADRELVIVEANQTLPDLLASGRAGAIVTDSFERKAFARPGWNVRCEPALARKVYWLAPNHAELAARIEAWLRTHRGRVESAQQRWFGETQPLSALGNLADLLARRMAFMPFVAGAKAKLGQPIEDLPREKLVLDSSAARALELGLPEARAREFFALQIELSKAVQRRMSEATTLDLAQEIRPALNELGDRILAAVVEARGEGQLAKSTLADLEVLSPWLNGDERQRLVDSLRGLGS